MALDDAKFQMISGYLMANGIKIQGEDSVDNEFLKLMESASDDNIDESGQHISKEEQEDKKVADDIVSHLDYEEDEKYLKNISSGYIRNTAYDRCYKIISSYEHS